MLIHSMLNSIYFTTSIQLFGKMMTESWAQAAHFAADDKCLSKLRSEFGDVQAGQVHSTLQQSCLEDNLQIFKVSNNSQL